MPIGMMAGAFQRIDGPLGQNLVLEATAREHHGFHADPAGKPGDRPGEARVKTGGDSANGNAGFEIVQNRLKSGCPIDDP